MGGQFVNVNFAGIGASELRSLPHVRLPRDDEHPPTRFDRDSGDRR